MTQVFHTKRTLTFRDGDPAQIVFFGNLFAFAHDAFEQFIVHAGYTWKEWFKGTELMIPIRHTEADYKAPFFPGETYDITVTVAHFGSNSFKMKYVFSSDGKTHATIHMVHALLNARTKQKTELPKILISRFEKYLEQETSR